MKGCKFMLGENIKRIRTSRKLSINALAKLCHMSPGYISDIEKNKKQNPTQEILGKVASALGVNIQDFYDEEKQLDEVDQLEQEFRGMFDRIKKMSPKNREKVLKMIELFEEENEK
jgi:transcriptional regulator with XRE-family HTH domain